MRASRKLTALVVEDEALIRADIVDEFRKQGWAVVETASGEKAIELARERDVDVVFTDIQLSGRLKGWDVAERLRHFLRRLAVVYTSGNTADRSRQVSGSLFFDKPYASEKVVEACEKLVAAA